VCCRRPVGGQGTSASYKSEASDVSNRTPASHRTQRQDTERSARCLSNASPMHNMLRARPRTHIDTDKTPPQHRMPPSARATRVALNKSRTHVAQRSRQAVRVATHADMSRYMSTCCNTSRHVATHVDQCVATHVDQCVATHVDMLQHISICRNTCRHVAMHVDMLQHKSTFCNTSRHVAAPVDQYVATHVDTLQHMSISRNTCRSICRNKCRYVATHVDMYCETPDLRAGTMREWSHVWSVRQTRAGSTWKGVSKADTMRSEAIRDRPWQMAVRGSLSK